MRQVKIKYFFEGDSKKEKNTLTDFVKAQSALLAITIKIFNSFTYKDAKNCVLSFTNITNPINISNSRLQF